MNKKMTSIFLIIIVIIAVGLWMTLKKEGILKSKTPQSEEPTTNGGEGAKKVVTKPPLQVSDFQLEIPVFEEEPILDFGGIL